MAFKMVLASLLSLAAAQLGTAAPPAPMVNDNVPGITYGAVFDGTQGANITGYVTISTNANGTGTVINVNLDNLPNEVNGPFLYHIHQFRVPEDGNCTATGGHLDPENRGEQPPCDATDKASCQVGDLAGKYGMMSTTPWQVVYTDLFTSTTPGSAAFVGNRSIVIHDLNTTRIACVNIHEMSAGVDASAPPSDSSCGASNSTGSAASTLAPYPTANVAQAVSSGSAQPSGAGAPAASSPAAGGYGAAPTSVAGVASPTGAAASGTPITPSTSPTIEASNGAAHLGFTGGAVFLAAAAFLL